MNEKNIDNKIFESLERIGESFRLMLTNQNKDYKLSNIQIQILIYLISHKKEFCTLTHLSKNFSITKASLSDSVKSLETKNYIIKEKSENDSRIYRIVLTESGLEMAKKLSDFSENIVSLISKIPDNNKKLILDSLLGIIHGLFVQELISIERMCFNCLYFAPSESNSDNYCKLLNKKLSKITKKDLKYYIYKI
ncbi:MAG: MarR family transcriptional regulator [Candidatus Sericytochromatia bacterium]